MGERHPCTWTDHELIRAPAMSVPPDDPDPFYWHEPGSLIVWIYGRHMNGQWVVRGPARRNDPLLD